MIRQWNLVRLTINDLSNVAMTTFWRHISDDVIKNPTNIEMTITFEQQIVKRSLTPHFVSIIHAQSENDVSAQNPA